jgi:CRISPR-associated protein Csm5
MKEYGHLKTYKMKLTTLSPVFIGGGEELSALDYCYDKNSHQLKIIDEEKFAKFLVEKHLLDDFMNFVMSNKNAKLYNWGKSKNITLINCPIYKKTYNNIDIKSNDINLFVKDNHDKAYIPGSSIKGAIRTAVLSQMLKESPEISRKYQQKIVTIAQNARNKREFNDAYKKIISQIEEDLLCVPSQNPNQTKETSDIFRGIHVIDSKQISSENLGIYQKIDYPLHAEKLNKLSVYRECIKPAVNVEFNITFDTNILKQKRIDMNYILKALKGFTDDWHELLSDFDDDLDNYRIYMPLDEEDYEANFCIGGGAGFLTKTIIYSIFEGHKKVAVSIVRKYLKSAFRDHYHDTRDESISPRTLKLASDRGDYINLGWCNISVV